MKNQDLIFFIVLFFLIYKNNPRWMVIAGLISLILSIPLFSFWIFFTAQRLIWYATAFLLIGIVFFIFNKNEKK